MQFTTVFRDIYLLFLFSISISLSQADLESALISADTGILRTNKPKDQALQELAAAIAELGTIPITLKFFST